VVRKITLLALLVIVVITMTLRQNAIAEQSEEDDIANAQRLVGVGLALTADTEHNKIIIIGVLDHSPAEAANICRGDVLIAIDGKAASADKLEWAVVSVRRAPSSQ